MKKLYIIRGLPGVGKSTFARALTEHVCEADMYFMEDGVYKYDHSKIEKAHIYCQNLVSLHMAGGNETIAVANIFSKRWQMLPYYNLAARYGYDVTEITLTGTPRESIHNVPAEEIQRALEGWQR